MPQIWKCNFCGEVGEAHYCTEYTNRKHIFFCHDCHNQFLGYKPVKHESLKKYLLIYGQNMRKKLEGKG